MQIIGYDCETVGEQDGFALQPYRLIEGRAEVSSAAFVHEDGTTIFAKLYPTGTEIQTVLHELPADALLVGHNVQFDIAWLITLGLEAGVREHRWIDTEVLRRAIENDMSEKSYSLKATVTKYLPEFSGYESLVGGNFEKVDDNLLAYNTLDAGLTAKLCRMFLDELTDTKRLSLSTLICEAAIPNAKAWIRGIHIDTDALDAWEIKAREDRDDYFKEFMRLSALHPSDAEPAKKMLTSPVKLKTFLKAKGHPVTKTDRTELSRYADVPMIKAISDWKKENTSITRFIKSIRESLGYNGGQNTHPNSRLWGTYTGRFTYSSKTLKKYQTGIAIHQFPRKSEARNCIVAPEGYLLVELDFATQESRLICDASGDPVLRDIFERGLDFHTAMAARIEGIEYADMIDRLEQKDERAKEIRYLAKIVNLSCQYRTGWKTLINVARAQYDVIFDEPTSKRLWGMYRETYKKVPEYWDDAIYRAKENGFAETRGGRRVEITDWSRANAWSAESTAINFPIQGTAADMKFLAIAMIDDPVYEAGGYYMLDLHDALFLILPDTEAGFECAVKCKEIISTLPYEAVFGWTPLVALPVDLKVGKAWGSLREIK